MNTTKKSKTRVLKKTENSVLGLLWHSIKFSNKKRANFTQDEFKNWAYSNKYKELYDVFLKNNFDSRLRPSVDRINPQKGYMFPNMQLITWEQNRLKGAKEQRILLAKPVIAYRVIVKKKKYKIFKSITNAEEELGIPGTNISRICQGRHFYAKGFTFEYVNNPLKKIGRNCLKRSLQ